MTTGVPPHDSKAEEAFLGAVLFDTRRVDHLLDEITPDMFYDPSRSHIYAAALRLRQAGSVVDPVTVATELGRVDLLATVGGQEYLFDLVSTPTRSVADSYAERIIDTAVRRQLLRVCREITELAFTPPGGLQETLDTAEQRLHLLTQQSTRMADVRPASQVIADYRKVMDAPLVATPSGWRAFDAITGGFRRGALNILGAPTGGGKTGAAVSVMVAAGRAGFPVDASTMEIDEIELMERLVSVASMGHERAGMDGPGGIPFGKLQRRSLTAYQRRLRESILDEIGSWPLFIDDNPAPSMAEIRSKARRVKAEYGRLGIKVVDYIQLLGKEGLSNQNRQVEVAAYSRGLKVAARELDMPVLGLVQVNKDPDNRTDKRARPEDIRESAAIAHDASLVIMIHREGHFDEAAEDPTATELRIVKHRNGPRGTVMVRWMPTYATYVDDPTMKQPMANEIAEALGTPVVAPQQFPHPGGYPDDRDDDGDF